MTDATREPGPIIRGMRAYDLVQVMEIERASFAAPWSRDNFQSELFHNRWSRNRVLLLDGRVVAYSSVWEVAGELSINNVAVHPEFRRRGLARRLVEEQLARARDEGLGRVTLEVRPSNEAARKLYASLGFVEVGRRRGYYRVEREDAIVMALTTTPDPG